MLGHHAIFAPATSKIFYFNIIVPLRYGYSINNPTHIITAYLQSIFFLYLRTLTLLSIISIYKLNKFLNFLGELQKEKQIFSYYMIMITSDYTAMTQTY